LFNVNLLEFRSDPLFSSFNFFFQAIFHVTSLGIGSYFVRHVGDGGHLNRKTGDLPQQRQPDA
jgi:hypothetical protein